ncbi:MULTISPECIES: hypothetical protein [Deinococcus]|uniref:Uncharacterized protein n=1 Tax=Deinococcus rufus TaxID=2136097 RepID=A0ABV7ZC35_9DEIO|nr:hypothetical protein [Deinococcus sp. AB2017081]WQE97309.1 hypothetical protein U2P90_19580 [Deinococcus sp. AB2017081]
MWTRTTVQVVDGREHDLHLLHISGDERAAFEENRWRFVFLTLSPLIGLTVTSARS